MAAKIKLQRKGKRGQPAYRFVIQEARAKLGGAVVDVLGEYNPRKEPAFINLNKEKTEAWLKKGAQPTEKVGVLLSKLGLLPAIDLTILPKRKSKKEKKEEAAAAAAQPKTKTEEKITQKPAKETQTQEEAKEGTPSTKPEEKA
ncbi:30S ribosomal protein S16 [candidate division WOR-1 bacterium RIFOXYC2_FULL_37_10]|uniref:Small ribosomal subunit protein bS16 n=1 Tax=candidate division WOR-1 bacterium RIFOXYB2_FULL_37_13 TaxID=1802579 RepID=A0A1F4SDP1_UNCSA|nr:MAG: 30S ribosomal protein S16 [candidate division WOR-1 bacterium RIFOXYA2_FULL_37_7]OGC18552.1 MAG: 30S ribosomal protein S16 [candidate division WOR-1 bacterium RIFOXYB2_FULL_37_13]OGC36870.1 MAG: 30S ribosomal protein S16 [candidate division WOR-1 bacterium RIFOXYC2_FULL_37_10]